MTDTIDIIESRLYKQMRASGLDHALATKIYLYGKENKLLTKARWSKVSVRELAHHGFTAAEAIEITAAIGDKDAPTVESEPGNVRQYPLLLTGQPESGYRLLQAK